MSPAYMPLVAVCLGLYGTSVMATNMRSPYNGLGAVAGTYNKTAQATMRYRVLVPWLIGWMPRAIRTRAYVAIHATLIGASWLAAVSVVGRDAGWILAFWWCMSFQYDYWDAWVEMLGICAILGGHPALTLVACIAWGMSRETAHIAPLYALLAHGAPLCAIAASASLLRALVRLWQGPADLYCPRWPWREVSLPIIRNWKTDIRPRVYLAVVWAAVALVPCFTHLPAPFESTKWALPFWVGSLYCFGVVDEPRVMLPTALWISAMMAG